MREPVGQALISVVAPVYNEIESIGEFYRRVATALGPEKFELVLVNDGSNDGTGEVVERLAAADPAIRPIHLSRNFGHQAAVSAGIDAAHGDAVVTIDADLQDPPELIPKLLDRWRDGAEVVHGVRHVRPAEARWRLAAIRLFYWLFNRISGLADFPGSSGDFRLMSRSAVDALKALPERNRFVRGLVAWVGFSQVSVVYERDPRYAGTSKYPLTKLIKLAFDAVVSFSALPLRLASWVGLLFSLVAFLAIPVIVVLRLTGLYEVPGIASVHILVLMIGGIQLVFLGVLGEYVARDYDETKRRPTYIVGPPPTFDHSDD